MTKTKFPPYKKNISHAEAVRISLENLHKIKDEDIDYSDAPELTDEFFANARLVKFVKVPISIRLDDDILIWFKSKNKRGYQSHINQVLRAYIKSADKKS